MLTDTQLLHMSLIPDIGGAVFEALQASAVSADLLRDHLYEMSAQDFMHHVRLRETVARQLAAGLADRALLEQEEALIAQSRVQLVMLTHAQYPRLLTQIPHPPLVLYVIGAPLQADEPMLAVVGSRAAHAYGQRAVSMMVPTLVQQGWTIISGGALGADSMAHRAALDVGGRTLAVLGSGLLRPYPTQNRGLFNDIVANGGTLVSPFPLTMAPLPHNFPARNRVISGMSRGCIVVQAAEQSGASITAHYALEQGREVFAVPGPIDDPLSAGCHRLIQQGARLVTEVADIIEEMGSTYRAGIRTSQATGSPVESGQKAFYPAQEPPAVAVRRSGKSAQVASVPSRSDQKSTYEPAAQFPQLSTQDVAIIQACSRPMAADALADQLALSLAQVQERLFDLQLEGVVEQNFAGLWQRR